MKRALGKILISLGAVLICLALLLLIYNQKEDDEAGTVSEEILTQIKEEIDGTENSMSDFYDPKTGLPSDKMKTVKIDGNEYIGYLSIPVLGLELPVMSEWSYPKLKIAPCREVGSVNTKDLIIAGHNYRRHFGNLKQLQPGELVLFTDMNQVTTAYTVVTTEILKPDQVEEMRSEEWDMTLYTCTYGGRTRVTVRCQKKNL